MPTSKAAGTPENALKAQVLAYLDKVGIFYRRMHSGAVRVKRGFMYLGPDGTADLAIYPKGKTVHWVELKAGATAKSRKEAQAAFAEAVKELGHKYALVRSVDELKDFLGS